VQWDSKMTYLLLDLLLQLKGVLDALLAILHAAFKNLRRKQNVNPKNGHTMKRADLTDNLAVEAEHIERRLAANDANFAAFGPIDPTRGDFDATHNAALLPVKPD